MLKKFCVSLFVFSLLALSCRNPVLTPIEEPDGGSNDPVVTTYTIIDELGTNLRSVSGLPESDIDLLLNGAKTSVGEDSPYIKDLFDEIVDGSVKAVGTITTPLNTTQRLVLINNIIKSVMTSIKLHKDDVMASPARAIDPFAIDMSKILAQLAAASIRNLSTAGIPASDLGTAAESTVNSLVSSLDDGGVQVDDIPSALEVITKSAVENIKANDTTSLSMTDAVSAIASAAVNAIDDIEVEGFDASLVSDVVGGVTSGATKAIQAIADNVDDVKILAATITGVSIASASVLSSVAVDVVEVTKSVTEKAVKAVADIKIDSIDTTSSNPDTNAIISSITQSAVTTAESAGVAVVTAQIAVVQSASEGAQSISPDYSADTLDDVIVVDSSGTTVAGSGDSDLSAAVTTGINQAANEPPVSDAGDNRSVDIDEETELNGSNSMDFNDSIVSWFWWIASAPADSIAVLENDNVVVTNFTPDVAGLYTIGLKVTDTYGETDTNFVQIACAIETYEGLNVSQRIALAQNYYNDGNLETALEELNKIFTFYSQTNSWSEAYLMQGHLLWDLERQSESVASFLQVRALDYDINHYGDATGALGWLYQWHLGEAGRDLNAAEECFNELLNDGRFTDTQFTGNAKHGLGFNHMMRGEYDEARTWYSNALSDHNLTNSETFWSKFHYGESYLWQNGDGDYVSAFIYWDEILASPATYLLTDKGETDYWKVQYLLGYKANVYRNNNNWTDALVQYQAILDYSGIPDEMKTWPAREIGQYHRDLGDQYCDSGDNASGIGEFEIAEDYFNDAWSYGNGSEDSAWAYVDKNWMFRRWIEISPDETERNSIISRYLSSCTAIFASGHDRPSVQTYLNRAGYYQWMTEPREFDNAYADYSHALSLAENNNLPEAVWARYEMGNHFRDKGWEYHRETGVDWEGFFNTALGHFALVTKANYPVYEDWMEHFFADALSDTADCYRGLERYSEAISLLSTLVGDSSNFSQQDRAWFQFDIGQSYLDMGHSSHDDGDFYGGLGSFSNAISGFSAAISLASGTDEEWRIDDKSNLRIGEAYKQSGRIYEDMDDEINAVDNFENAIDSYLLVSNNEYWMYYEARSRLAECYQRSGDFQNAIDTYQDIINNIADNEEDLNRIYFEIADAYRDQYYRTNDPVIYSEGLSAYDDVLSLSGLAGDTAANALLGKGSLIRDYAFIQYRDQGQPGLDFENLMIEAIEVFDEVHYLSDDFDWWGDARSEAYREAGYCYKDMAWNYNDYMGESYDAAVTRGYLDDSITSLESAMDTGLLGSIDEGNYNDAKRELGWTYFEMANTYNLQDSASFSDAEPYIVNGMDLGFEVLADNDAERDMQAQVMNAFGYICINGRGNTIELASETFDLSLTNAVYFFGLVIGNYSDLETGRYAAEAQKGLGHAYLSDGFDLRGVGDYAGAIDSLTEAVVQFDLVPTNYSSLPEWEYWLVEDSLRECINTLFELAQTQESVGNITGAIESLQGVISRSSLVDDYRIDEANSEIIRLQI